MNKVFLLAGHSFISRFYGCLCDPALQHFEHNFGLQGCQVSSFAQGGWKLWDMMAASQHLPTYDPSCIFIQIGENDISTMAPEVLAMYIIECAEFLMQHTGASWGYVGQLLHRQRSKYLPTEDLVVQFNQRIDIANRVLKVLASDSTVTYWRHKGLMNPAIGVLHSDGTHLNQIGLFKYYRSIKGIALECFSL